MKHNYFYKNKLKIIIFLLIVISFALRFYNLGKVPKGLSVDEADFAYNAYSVLKTGKDVYGRTLPLFFQSLDSNVPGFAIYASIPAIYFFGLNDISIKILPAIMGALTPLLMFFLVKALYPKDKYLPIISMILLTFAPWNIAISRALWLYIELLFFYILFFIILLKGFNKNFKLILLSSIVLAITQYIYFAAIIYIPLILITVVIIYRKKFLKEPKLSILALILLIILSLPTLIFYKNSGSRSRLNAISILQSDITLPISISEIQTDVKNNNKLFTLFHNRRLVFSIEAINNYFKYLRLDYIFVNSKEARLFYVNYVGLLYLVELPFFLYGLFYLIRKIKFTNNQLILYLFLISPVPAIFTLGTAFPHRIILFLFFIQIISALGVLKIYEKISKTNNKYRNTIIVSVVIIYMVNIIFFLHQYFVHSPIEFSSETNNGAWYSTVSDIIPAVNRLQGKYDHIIITWSQQKLVPPVYFMFYNKIDPTIFQQKASLWTNETPSFKQIYNKIGNIEFRPINWELDQMLKNTLLIGYPSEFPKNVDNVINKSYDPDGQTHFIFVANP